MNGCQAIVRQHLPCAIQRVGLEEFVHQVGIQFDIPDTGFRPALECAAVAGSVRRVRVDAELHLAARRGCGSGPGVQRERR